MTNGFLGLDRAGHLDRAAEQQQLFGQRGLACVGVRDDRERPAAGDFVLELVHDRVAAETKKLAILAENPRATAGDWCRAGTATPRVPPARPRRSRT